MIELRHLAHLIAACERENLTRAAEDLDVAPSTLSASLKALETELDLGLFKRLGSGLYPRVGARWVFRAGLPLLLLERHTRRTLQSDIRGSVLQVHIGLKFTIGRISKAVLSAIRRTEIDEPDLLVHPVWTDDDPTPFDGGWARAFDLEDTGAVRVEMMAPGALLATDQTAVLQDSWVLVRRSPSEGQAAEDGHERVVMAPLLSGAMSLAVEAHLARAGVRLIRPMQAHPGSLPRLLSEHPDAAFLLPGSAISERLGLSQIAVVPLDPPLVTPLVARGSGGPCAERFIERLRQALAETRSPADFSPALTSRRLRYFNLTHRLRSVSAAARLANVAQPALSEQLRKLEVTLGSSMFDRRSSGVTPTPQAARFAPAAQAIEAGLQALRVGATAALAAEERPLSLGVLPSVSQHGLLVGRISEAILELRDLHPAARVKVQEAPNGVLQDWVVRGQVGLAIVETGPPQLPRLSLGASEPLAVIAHPRFALLPAGPAPLAMLAHLPLALPTPLSGLRQLLDSAAQARRVRLQPVMEIDALAMLIALVRGGSICTVLPPSAVRRELEAGELCARSIVDPEVLRRLFVIYSGERGLTDAERAFVGLLRAGLALDHRAGEVMVASVAWPPPPSPELAALH